MSNRGCISVDVPPSSSRLHCAAKGKRHGVTLLELLIVITMIGTITAFALPRVRTAQNHEATRGARREVQAAIARAKGSAVQRGCRATVHFRQAEDKFWVTACRMIPAAGSTLDTLGGVVYVGARYGVRMTVDADSIPFAPNSLGLGTATINMGFSKAGYTSSMQITPIGRPIW